MHDTYRFDDDLLIGVRWSEPGLHERVRERLRDHLDSGPSPDNVSVVVGGRRGAVRDKHQLRSSAGWSSDAITDDGIVDAVLVAVDDLVKSTRPSHLIRLRATAIVGADDRTVVVDERLWWKVDGEWSRLRREGWQVVDVPALYLAPGSGRADLRRAVAAAPSASARSGRHRDALVDVPDDLPIHRIVVAADDPELPTGVNALPIARPTIGAITLATASSFASEVEALEPRQVEQLDDVPLDELLGS